MEIVAECVAQLEQALWKPLEAVTGLISPELNQPNKIVLLLSRKGDGSARPHRLKRIDYRFRGFETADLIEERGTRPPTVLRTGSVEARSSRTGKLFPRDVARSGNDAATPLPVASTAQGGFRILAAIFPQRRHHLRQATDVPVADEHIRRDRIPGVLNDALARIAVQPGCVAAPVEVGP